MECLANVLERKYPQFNTVSPEHSLKDALYQMCCENLEYLVVLKGEEFVGIVSERDVAHKLFATNSPINELKVKDIMNTALPVGSSSDGIDYAMQVIGRHNSRYIAVFDQFAFRGIVSEKDLLETTVASRTAMHEEPAYQKSYEWAY